MVWADRKLSNFKYKLNKHNQRLSRILAFQIQPIIDKIIQCLIHLKQFKLMYRQDMDVLLIRSNEDRISSKNSKYLYQFS